MITRAGPLQWFEGRTFISSGTDAHKPSAAHQNNDFDCFLLINRPDQEDAHNSAAVLTMQHFLVSVSREAVTQKRMRKQGPRNTHFMAQMIEYHTALQPPSQLMGPLV